MAGLFTPSTRAEPDQLALTFCDSTNPTIYALIQRLAEDCTSPPIKLMRGEGEKATPVEQHPALDLIRQPNPVTPGIVHTQQTYADLLAAGDAFDWLQLEGTPPRPVQRIRMPPHEVEVIEDRRVLIAGYKWQHGKFAESYPRDQVLHVKTRNPQSIYRGLGILPRLRDFLILEREAMRWQAHRYANDIPVDLIFSTQQKFTDPEVRKRVEATLDSKFTGRRNKRRWAMLEEALWKVDAVPRPMEKDLQYLETLKWIRTTYAMAFGVPPNKLSDFSDAFRANAEEQERVYWEDTVMQWHVLYLDALNSQVLRRFWPEEQDLAYVYDYSKVKALNTSAGEQAEMAAKRTAGHAITTINEERERQGIKPHPNPLADELLYNGRAIGSEPVDPFGLGNLDPEDEDEDAPEGEQPEDEDEDREDPRARERRGRRAPLLTLVRRDFGDRPASDAGLFDSGDVFDHIREAERLGEAVERIIAAMVREAGEQQLRLAGLPAVFNVRDPEVLRFVSRQIIDLREAVTLTTEHMVRHAIAESLRDGVTIREMRRRIQDAYTVRRKDWQLDRVARTETHQAQEGGSYQAAKQARLEFKRWITARDSRVRGLEPEDQSDHAALEGVVVPIDGLFVDRVSGAQLKFPGDREGAVRGSDTINCRCTWVADFSHLDEDAKALAPQWTDAALASAWTEKATTRERWEIGLARILRSFLRKQERRVLAEFDRKVREAAARRGEGVSSAAS